MKTHLTFAAPLENIRNSQEIAVVVLGGKLLPKEPLPRMLAEADAAASTQQIDTQKDEEGQHTLQLL
jgi:hypothetical protein